jgi:hypothetical protein
MNFKLKGYNTFLNEAWSGDAINVFDIDDCILVSSALIHVYDPIKKKKFSLTPAEYNEFKAQKHHKIDYSDFDKIEIMRKGIIVDWVFTILKKTMNMRKAVAIITARGDAKMIKNSF